MKLCNLPVVFAFLTFPTLCLAADNPFLSTLEDGSTIARNASGVVLWHNFNGVPGSSATAATPPNLAAPSSVSMPMWDPPTTLDSTPESAVAGPIFDSLGNAWVVINDYTNLIAVQSNGTSGTWQTPHIIGPTVPSIGTVGVAVDRVGGFYVTYGTSASLSSTSNPLMLAKYTTATGWQAAVQIYNSPNYFNEVFPSVDSTGRLVVVFDPYQTGSYGVSSIASNASQTAWGAVQTIAPFSESVILPSVASNKSGTRVALIYLSYLRGRHGMRYSFFDPSTGKWNKTEAVPNAENTIFTTFSILNAFPTAVDEPGNVTFAAALQAVTRSPGAKPELTFTVGGFRYENGQWSMKQLTAPSRSIPDLDNLGGVSINENGGVLISAPLFDGSSGVNITAFRYTPGQGWNTEIAAHYNSSVAIRCKVTWFEGTGAVVVYGDFTLPGVPLLAALYSNGAWSSGPPPPGNPSYIVVPSITFAPSGEALLAAPDNPAVNVSFLRP